MNIKNIATVFIVTGLLVGAKTTFADTTTTLSASDYSELDSLRSQNSILKEQLANAELKSKIEAVKGIKMPAATAGFPTKATYIDRSARVELVEGVGTKLAATIQLSDGGNVIAHAGMRISNLGFIKSIKTNEVLVQNGKETFSIPFLTEANINSAQTQTGSINQAFTGNLPMGNLIVPSLSQPGTN